ncbi:mannitol-specific phosphotransferase system IIBC component [Microbacterium proteolyticum]|uniref:Mannitol-specific phosphotransferase system IIBC component n=1 Tax=Microbacterium proteolyticum TaxID=1572644 RepID=A0A7W5GF50_9MICO|nr:mannitol-specific phosphotransferase system IIBC component [Microbacterium proteolyticum]
MTRRALPLIRRLETCGTIGLVCGALLGALFVLIGWFPSALAMHADNPTFLLQSLLAWCAGWAVVCGAVGLVVGVIVSVLVDVGDRFPDHPPRQ